MPSIAPHTLITSVLARYSLSLHRHRLGTQLNMRSSERAAEATQPQG